MENITVSVTGTQAGSTVVVFKSPKFEYNCLMHIHEKEQSVFYEKGLLRELMSLGQNTGIDWKDENLWDIVFMFDKVKNMAITICFSDMKLYVFGIDLMSAQNIAIMSLKIDGQMIIGFE